MYKGPAKVLVGVPSMDTWKADFAMSLIYMVTYSARSTPAGGPRVDMLRLWNSRGSLLPRQRTTLVKQALEMRATHILFLDSDMTFPANTLECLLSRGKSVVAANCAVKQIPSQPTARAKSDKPNGEQVFTHTSSVGLERVWRVGTGIMLVETRVFRQISEPWFPFGWNEETKEYVGEDWEFCKRLEAAEIPIYIDHSLSKSVGHIGDFVYEHKHVEPLYG